MSTEFSSDLVASGAGNHGLTVFISILLMLFAGSAQPATWQHERGQLELLSTPERIVALDWAATEALLLLGITPVGVGDRDYYPIWVREPALPEGSHNVGARRSPSLEAIAELKPDLIVTSGHLVPAWALLESIAPTYVMSIYDRSGEPFERARTMLLILGDILDREKLARARLHELDAALAGNRRRLEVAGLTDRPIALVNFMDDRHVRINASNGIFDAALEGLGLKNAWQRPGNVWGFAMIGLEDLADRPDARIVAISPTAAGLGEQLSASPFWTWLPAVRQNEVYQIDPVWAYGGVGAVQRLAGLLTEALLAGGGSSVR
ncbi:iron-siderophore ABC transporter substrate-binding protein [Marinobacter sp.]|uniref:iron-siderophore ABC transporter substrate-binding protein n=1 Tax=Marinobacter sp. TaxID=50741 RepID=UPI00384DCBA4